MSRLPARAVLAVVMASILGLVGCGADDSIDGIDPTVDDGPRVAHPRFEGDWLITEVDVGGAPVALAQGPGLQIDARFGALTVQPGCNVHYGSFTLAEDGAASFTVTGGSDLACQTLGDQEEAVLAALDDVTGWAEVDGGFRFAGPSSALVIVGPTG